MRGSGVFALLAGATCISLSPIWVRIADVGPTASAFWRVALAIPVLWGSVFFFSSGVLKLERKPFLLLLAAGIAFSGDLAFWHWSIQFTSVANSTLLANLASIFVTLAAWILWRQRPSGTFLVGLAAALLGVALLVRASLGFSARTLLGDGLGVITAMFYAWYLLSVKGVRDRGVATLQLMAVTTTITAVILLPVALASGEALLPASATGWLKLLGLAWISHSAGQGLIAYALAHLPAAFSSVGLLFQPVMAAGFAWLLLAEPLAPLQIVGGAVVLVGIYLAHRGANLK
ncbi:MAG TPA: DMT family transporter [Burkholderiales bacterium]|jgi:drug/metabolite transporter (DMT)-like permease|nr:DMT family transporter [Burkholderiales bacterium]